MMPVTTIQRPLLLLIFPPDSNVESSNMASLDQGIGLPLFRHRGGFKCSRVPNRSGKACSTYIRTATHTAKLVAKTVHSVASRNHAFPENAYARDRFAAGNEAALLLPVRHCA